MSAVEATAGQPTVYGSFLFNSASLIQHIVSIARQVIEQSSSIPGFDGPIFDGLKPGLLKYLDQLVSNGVIEVTGADAEVRPYFVVLQAIFEHVLAEQLGKSISDLMGIILTPMPATPLCKEGSPSREGRAPKAVEDDLVGLVDPAIVADPARAFTVQLRTTIVRNYLSLGGKVYVVYPQEGLAGRTPEQLAIYKKECERYSGKNKEGGHEQHLFDCPLNCTAIDDAFVGATYVFKDRFGQMCVFALQITQAAKPHVAEGNFGMWLGAYPGHAAVKNRVDGVLGEISRHAPELRISLPV